MYKLIIVDDEQVIREGIAASIPWQEWGFEVSGLFANGRQALEYMEKDTPDVVLSDICMPKMDGVELMQVLNERFPQVKIIILSGYSDFEYLNMSIKNNVSEYLLKPTDVDDFEALFKKVRRQLDETRQQQKENAKGQESLCVDWLNLLLKGYFDDNEALGILEEYRHLRFDNCAVVLFTPDGRLGDDERELYRLKTNIVNVCNVNLNTLDGFFFLNHEELVTGIIGLPPEHNLDRETLTHVVQGLQKMVLKELKTTVSVGISTLCTEPDMLSACYQQAKCCVRQNVFLGAESLFFYSQFEDDTDTNEDYFNIDTIKQALLAGDLDALNTEIGRVFAAFENRALKHYDYVDQMCIDTLFGISRWALQYNVRFEQIVDSLGTSYTDIYRCDSLDKKQHFLVALLYALQQKLAEAKSMGGKRSSLAYMVKSCVDEEFVQNALSLEYVAERLHKTPAHISKVFKNELGLNFSEYLTRKRLEKSTELLGDLSLKVYEIAGMIGYADTSNFIKVFKKHYGISPNEYRQSLAGRHAG